MQPLSIFLETAKFADFWRKNGDVSRTQLCTRQNTLCTPHCEPSL